MKTKYKTVKMSEEKRMIKSGWKIQSYEWNVVHIYKQTIK